jgi:tetratricopeptide (TPR) repeat protein
MHRDAGDRFQTAQELRDALEDFRARLSVDSAIAAAWKEEDPAARERALKEIVGRFPRDPKVYRNLAWFYNGQVRFGEATHALEDGRINCPRCGELMVDLALAYCQVGQIRRAIDTLDEAKGCGLPPDMQQRVAVLLTSWRKRS